MNRYIEKQCKHKTTSINMPNYQFSFIQKVTVSEVSEYHTGSSR